MSIKTKFGILTQLGIFLFVNCENFEFGDQGTACILLDIDASFNLTYNDGTLSEEADIFDLKGANVINSSSLCSDSLFGNNSILMVRLYPSGEALEFSFQRQLGEIIMHVRLFLHQNKHFNDTNYSLPIEMKDYMGLKFGILATSDFSYECHTQQDLHFIFDPPYHMTMTISDIQAQAYSITNGTFGPAKECKQDLLTTTEPPEVTTSTEPGEITTTIEPDVSTEHTQTTEPIPIETSTVPNVETTTHPDTSDSSVTTRPVPMTTEPTPGIPKYVVKENGIVCIVMEGLISFDIPYRKKDNTMAVVSNITLPNKVDVEGKCHVNGSTQELTIKFFDKPWTLDIIIMADAEVEVGNKLEDGGITYTWTKLKLSYIVDKHFTDAKSPGIQQSAEANGAFGNLKVGSGSSFKCHANEDFSLDNGVHLKLSDIQYRAFGSTGSSDFSKNDVTECAADHHSSGNGGHDDYSKLGTVLGGVFGSLAVIILVAGVVWYIRKRKNNNQNRRLNYS